MTDTRTGYISLVALLAIFQFAIAIAVTASFAQESEAPLPEGVVAMVNGETVSEADYRNFLFHHIGRSKLDDFVDKILVEEEAQRLGVRVSFNRIIERAEREFEQSLEFFDSPTEYEVLLRKRGLTAEDVKAEMRKRLILEETLDLCILERRKRAGENIGEEVPSLADRQSFLEELRARGEVKISGR